MSNEDVENFSEEVVLKVVVCGDGSSGKTSLCQRFTKDTFERSYHQSYTSTSTTAIDADSVSNISAEVQNSRSYARRCDCVEMAIPCQCSQMHCATIGVLPWSLVLVHADIIHLECRYGFSAMTLGLDFFSKRISLPGDVQVLMQVWDIGGQSIAGEMISKYIYGSHAALIVYDVTNMNSFDNCQDWLNVIRRVTKSQEKPPQIVLVGNKVDEERLRKVAVDHHCRFAKQHDLKAFYVSAKTGDSVTVMFRQVAADVLRIVLTRMEQEADIAIVQGAVGHDVKDVRHRHVDQSRNTTVCSIQ